MINDFIRHFTKSGLFWTKIREKYYLADERLLKIAEKIDCKVSVGMFLGEDIEGKFKPSLALLSLLSKFSSEKVFLNSMGEVDFVYNRRKLRKRHIASFKGSPSAGTLKLVQNELDENLGYCEVTGQLNTAEMEIKSLLDRGDFLRRERKQEKVFQLD